MPLEPAGAGAQVPQASLSMKALQLNRWLRRRYVSLAMACCSSGPPGEPCRGWRQVRFLGLTPGMVERCIRRR